MKPKDLSSLFHSFEPLWSHDLISATSSAVERRRVAHWPATLRRARPGAKSTSLASVPRLLLGRLGGTSLIGSKRDVLSSKALLLARLLE